jgi:hypothetical protein
MKNKNLPEDNNFKSLEELTNEANNIIASLEREKDLQNSVDAYQGLLKLNDIIINKNIIVVFSIQNTPGGHFFDLYLRGIYII